MTEPTGFTAVGMVGFTDQGTYSASATYVKNDLVHYGGSIWCCLVDDTTGITPTEGVNWRFWVENSQNGISDIVNILGAKNLLKISATSQVKNGVTFTINDDGSITVDGTATADASLILSKQNFGAKSFDTKSSSSSQYIVSGLPSNDCFYLAYYQSLVETDLVVKSGYTVDNVRVYPMIRPKNIEDATWVPYSKTNQELTAEVTQNTSDIQTLTNQVSTNASNISANATAIAKCETLVVSVASFSALPQTITNANIDDDMVVVNSVLSNPIAQTDDWTVTTSSGSLTISGSISGTTIATLYLMKSR